MARIRPWGKRSRPPRRAHRSEPRWVVSLRIHAGQCIQREHARVYGRAHCLHLERVCAFNCSVSHHACAALAAIRVFARLRCRMEVVDAWCDAPSMDGSRLGEPCRVFCPGCPECGVQVRRKLASAGSGLRPTLTPKAGRLSTCPPDGRAASCGCVLLWRVVARRRPQGLCIRR